MPTVHLVHGFNVSDRGGGSIAKLAPYFESAGMDSTVFSYGWIGLMGVWFLNPRIVRQFMPRVKPGDIGVGHSNGCVLLHMAAVYGAPFSKLVYLSPALSSNAPGLPPQIEAIHVWHTDGDLPVKFAAWLRALVPWAPIGDPLWGDMGARGYQPARYEDATHEPEGIISNTIHTINIACIRWPSFLLFLQISIGIPFALMYWFIAAPVEVMLTFYRNNLVGNDPDMALTVKRNEDRRFILVALLVPCMLWTIVLLLI